MGWISLNTHDKLHVLAWPGMRGFVEQVQERKECTTITGSLPTLHYIQRCFQVSRMHEE
jgi:hypothetical protein